MADLFPELDNQAKTSTDLFPELGGIGQPYMPPVVRAAVAKGDLFPELTLATKEGTLAKYPRLAEPTPTPRQVFRGSIGRDIKEGTIFSQNAIPLPTPEQLAAIPGGYKPILKPEFAGGNPVVNAVADVGEQLPRAMAIIPNTIATTLDRIITGQSDGVGQAIKDASMDLAEGKSINMSQFMEKYGPQLTSSDKAVLLNPNFYKSLYNQAIGGGADIAGNLTTWIIGPAQNILGKLIEPTRFGKFMTKERGLPFKKAVIPEVLEVKPAEAISTQPISEGVKVAPQPTITPKVVSEPQPVKVYHGGAGVDSLNKKFEILSPEQKRAFPSSNVDLPGLSMTTDKGVAENYSKSIGNRPDVFEATINPEAKILKVDTKGDGIEGVYTYNDIQKIKEQGYDAIQDISPGAENEFRALTPNAIKTPQPAGKVEPRITVTSETKPAEIQAKLKELPLFPNKTENLRVLNVALDKALQREWGGMTLAEFEKIDKSVNPDDISQARTIRERRGLVSIKPTGKPVFVQVDGTWKIENTTTAILKAIDGIKRPKLEKPATPNQYRIPPLKAEDRAEIAKMFKEAGVKPLDTAISAKPEFIEDVPPIGLSTGDVVPSAIRIDREPKDMTGAIGMLKSWFLPVRHIAEKNPTSIKIARMGRDTISGLGNEQAHYNDRIDFAWRGLRPAEKSVVIDALQGKVAIEKLTPKQLQAYTVSDQVRTEMLQMIEGDLKINTAEWGIKPEEYFPHIFVGSYQIRTGNRTIDGGFANTLREAVGKAVAYIKENPKADINIAPKGFNNDYSATMLSRKGFYRFINEVKKATTLDKDEIMSMMKGVAAIKPRGKFVGNFQQRVANLGGYMQDEKALKIYVGRILRKKWLDPFVKQGTEMANTLPDALRAYFTEYVESVGGKYDPYDNQFRVSWNTSKILKAQSQLKLGYRPVTALVNRLQPMQTAFAEIGNDLFKGNIFKQSAEGKKVIEDSAILGQLPKYFSGEKTMQGKVSLLKPLGMFSRAEMANREDVIAGGFLFARRVLSMPEEVAVRRGYGYIREYLKEFPDPYKAAIEYARDLNADTNYIYDISDLPKIFRKPLGRVVFQFKTYPINFAAQSIKWLGEAIIHPNAHNTARAARFVGANIVLGGVRAIPFVGRNLWRLVMISAGLSMVNEKVRRTLGRGIFSLLGIDMSKRLGPGDFMPRDIKSLGGPTGGDVYNLYRTAKGETSPMDFLANISGVGRDIYRSVKGGDEYVDIYRRNRKITTLNWWEKLLEGIGAPIEKVEIIKDIQAIDIEASKQFKLKKAQYVDAIIERQDAGKGWADVGAAARKDGILIKQSDLDNERKQKNIPALQRTWKTVPKQLRPGLYEFNKMGVQ